MKLPDIQTGSPKHKFSIQNVGISNLKMPIFISQKDSFQPQHTVADVNVFVSLDANKKGTHMSRLAIEAQNNLGNQLSVKILRDVSEKIRIRAEAESCTIVYNFPYFITKTAPASNEKGITYAMVQFKMTNSLVEGVSVWAFIMTVTSTTTSLCPCSKEISESGAHNQRSKITIQCSPKENSWIWIEDLVKISESASSCEIYSVLKRQDEKAVTEKAYKNPKFVEDMVREIYSVLIKRDDIYMFNITVENEESIHQHNAYASMSAFV